MADENAIRKPRTAEQLRRLLEDFQYLGTWKRFKEDFLKEILKAQRANRETIFFGLGESTEVEIDSILAALPEFFTSETGQFFRRSLLPKWSQELSGKTVTSDQVAPQTFQLIKEQSEQAKNPRELENLITSLEEVLQNIQPEAPTDEDAVRSQLLELLNPNKNPALELSAIKSDLDEILGAYESEAVLEIPDNIKLELRTAPEEKKDDWQSEVDSAKEKADKDLNSALEAVLDENWERPWTGNDRAEAVIESLRESARLDDKATSEKLVDTILELLGRSGALPTPGKAYQDFDIFFIEFIRQIEPDLELLKKRREELIKEHQEKLNKDLAAIFAPPPAATGTEGGGEAEQPSEEAPPTDKGEVANAARTQLATHFTAVRQIDPVTLPTVIGLLVGVAANVGYAVDPAITQIDDLQAALFERIDGQVADETETPVSLKTKLDSLLSALREADSEYLEAAEVEKPEVAPPTPAALVTELPGGVELSDAQARKSVGELMEAQQLMVRQGLEELRLTLRQAKFSEAEIEQILQRNRDDLSQQIWQEFLQRGGLRGDLSFVQMATIWSGVVQQTSQRILVEQGKQTSPLLQAAAMAGVSATQIERLQKFLRQSGYSEAQIEDAFAHLNISTFEQLATFAQRSGALSRDQRAATIKDLLQGAKFAETDAGLAAGLIADNNFFGLLEHQLKKQPPILTLNQQRELQKLIQKTQLSSQDQTKLAEILSLLLAQYPPEVFAHLGANELAQVHEYLARQQKAMEIIGQQLANFPKSGFANPYTGVTLKRTANITEEQATTHAKDTLMMEITLSIAFETRQDVHLALVMQEFYADPKKNLIWLASGLGSAYDEEGGLLPEAGDETLAPQRPQLLAAQRAQFGALAGKQQAVAAAQQQNEMVQKAALLRAVLASGGNPALLAKNLLTDPAARGALIAEFEKHKFEILAAMALPALPLLALLGIMQQVVQFIGNIISGIGNFIGSVGQGVSGFFSGLSGSTTAGLSGTTLLAHEMGANAATTAKVATSQAIPVAQTAGTNAILNTFNGFNTLLAGTTTAFTPLAAIIGAVLGPMVFAVIMTFIVFSVIGSSLNGTTTEIGLVGGIPGIGRSGCWPVDGSVTDLEHPSNRVIPGGTAIDIGAAKGSPIYSPFAGTARARFVTSGPNSAYGLFVDMRTDLGFRVLFAHMIAFNGVSSGDTFTVAAGDVIGFVGSTGNSSGPHVHYEAVGVNLYTLLPVPRNQLSIGYATSTSECKGTSQASEDTPAPNPGTIGPQ